MGLAHAYEEVRRSVLMEASEPASVPRGEGSSVRAIEVSRMAILGSRRILQVRGSAAWIAFMRAEIAAATSMPSPNSARADVPRPRLVGARYEQVELLNLLATLVIDSQLRRVSS